MKVNASCEYEFEVIDRKCRRFVVNLNSRICTCGQFQLDHFVCVHAVAAICSRPGLSCYSYISSYYTREQLLATWSGIMHQLEILKIGSFLLMFQVLFASLLPV
ncbi:unnamed protein product [Cuscuta europaea]|uniref:SWIM-type domain-containing protein n=1 Tax=Cuscuta europaea TaxID=41803 RepID=A0A9P0ZPY8_CUSEU|nr:unnamed protein product [Cuscuta europaea]